MSLREIIFSDMLLCIKFSNTDLSSLLLQIRVTGKNIRKPHHKQSCTVQSEWCEYPQCTQAHRQQLFSGNMVTELSGLLTAMAQRSLKMVTSQISTTDFADTIFTLDSPSYILSYPEVQLLATSRGFQHKP